MITFKEYKTRLNEDVNAIPTHKKLELAAMIIDEIKLADDSLLRAREYEVINKRHNLRIGRIEKTFVTDNQPVAWGLIRSWSRYFAHRLNMKVKKKEMIEYLVRTKSSPIEKAEYREQLQDEDPEVIEVLFDKEYRRQKLIHKLATMTPQERTHFMQIGADMPKKEKEHFLQTL